MGLPDSSEGRRVALALADEGFIVETSSTSEALRHLADESFDLAFLASPCPRDAVSPDPLSVWRELRPFTDVVLISDGDPAACARAFAQEASAVLPRPLPDVDVLLRAHIRRLAAYRRARTRGVLVLNAFVGQRPAVERVEPRLAEELASLLANARSEPTMAVEGDAAIAECLGAVPTSATPDVVVLAAHADVPAEETLRAARERGPGAALILVDEAPSPERLRDAIYGGARAYVPRSELPLLGRIAAAAAARHHAESIGVSLIDVLARYGVTAAHDAPRDRGYDRSRKSSPHRDVDLQLIAETTASQPAPPVVPSAHEVLVVDDEAIVLTVLREALRRGGYRVTTAASAEEAIDLMQKRRFDLVLTDKNLPGASGLDVLRAARGLSPAPAIVLITGYSSFDSALEAMDIGAQDYIEKPIRDVEDLRFRVRRALTRRDEQLARPRLAPTGRAGRVLLVEQEGTRRRLIADYLGRTYQVIAAEDGDQALDRLKQEHFDLVVADRHLPGVSGLRVIEHAQRLLPHCATVLYTAYPSYESVKEAFSAGVDAYLTRPSEDLKKLGEKVAEALGGRGGILLG